MMDERLCYIIIFLSEALIAWIYFEYLFVRKSNGLLCAFSFLAGYAVLYGISLFKVSAANTIAFCVINLFLAWLNYDCSVKSVVLHAAFLTFIMAIAEILIALVMSLFGYAFTAYSENISVLIAMAVTSKLLYLVLSIVGSRLFAPNKHRSEDPQLMILFCGIPLLSSGMAILVIYLGSNSEMNRTSGVLMTLNVLAMLIVNLVFIVLYNHSQRTNEEYMALQLSIQKDQADAVYYQVLQEQSERQRILIHDIKNHLRTLAGLAVSGNQYEIKEYVSKLELSLEPEKRSRYSNDPILNMILLRSQNECIQKEIDFQVDIRDGCESFMDGPGKTSLFGNLLSNAIEAAEISSDRFVEFSICRNDVQSIIVISVMNSCDNAPQLDGHGGYLTNKRMKDVHGVGLRSIERIVRKYRGVATMYYDAENKRFHHVIQFPVDLTSNTSLCK